MCLSTPALIDHMFELPILIDLGILMDSLEHLLEASDINFIKRFLVIFH